MRWVNVAERADAYAPLPGKTNFAWNLIGKAAYAASKAMTLILIAKLGSAEMMGQYALAIAIATPVFMLADLDLRSVLATDSHKSYVFGSYLGLRLVTTLLAMAVVCVFACVQRDLQASLVLLLVGAAKSFEAISDMQLGLLQQKERMDKLGISQIIKSVLSISAMGLLLWLRHSLAEAAAGMAVVYLAVLIFYEIPTIRPYERFHVVLKPGDLWRLMRLSLPLGIVLLFSSLNKNISNYFIESLLGSESLGYFTSMLYILATGSLAVNALGQSVNVRLARFFGSRDTGAFTSTLLKSFTFVVVLGACMLLVSVAFGKELLTFFFRPEYAAHFNEFIVIMCAAGVTYAGEIMNFAVTATRRFRIQPIAYGIVLVAGIAMNFILVPKWGLMGAALSILVTSCLQLAVNLLILIRLVRERKNSCPEQHSSEGGPSSCSDVTVERISSITMLTPDFLDDWKTILTQNGGRYAFSDPDWLVLWWESYGSGRELYILAIRAKGELITVIPLAADSKPFHKRLRFMGNPQASQMDLAIQKDCVEQAVWAFIEYVQGMAGNVIVDLGGLSSEDPTSKSVMGYLQAAHVPMLTSHTIAPHIRTEMLDFNSFYRARFSSKQMKNYRREYNRLTILGTVSFRELSENDMGAAFELHDRRWMKKLDTSGFTEQKSRAFFTRLLSNPNNRWKPFALGLYLDAKLIAFQYGFLCGSTALLYKSAHDNLLGVYALGKLMKSEYIHRCFGMGLSSISLGIGFEEYKKEWTDENEIIASLAFPKKNFTSRLIFQFYSARGILLDRLKSSRRIVLFKRNTLGKMRYYLSFRHIAEECRRVLAMIQRHGLSVLLQRAFPVSQSVQFWCAIPKGDCLYLDGQGGTCPATLDDVPALSLLMLCSPEEVIRRFHRQHRCILTKRESGIVSYAWIVWNKTEATVYDYGYDRKTCCEQDFLLLLHALPYYNNIQKCEAISLVLRKNDSLAIHAASKAESHEAVEKDTNNFKEG